MIYTRQQMLFISGIGVGYCDTMERVEINDETIIDPRMNHTDKEVKNGQEPALIKTSEGWIHLAHGVRRTVAGLRYSLYCCMTDLKNPVKVLRRPSGQFIEPLGKERVRDVSNVTFSNGWILDDDGMVYIYYTPSDTRMHVATTILEKLLD